MKILGLDLGITSIGWAYINENEKNRCEIERLGVRIIQYGDNLMKKDKSGKVTASMTPEEDFKSGKGLSPNAGRTQKRGMRRNLQRYKQRRNNLIEILTRQKFISSDTKLAENGKSSTFSTYKLRAKAVSEKISKEELALVLLMINKKRGYKSNRKLIEEGNGQSIDALEVTKKLYDTGQTPGQLCYALLESGVKQLPDFYRSDLHEEFNKVWDNQQHYFSSQLLPEIKEKVQGKTKKGTTQAFFEYYKIDVASNTGKPNERRLQAYKWRANAISEKLSIEEAIYVLAEINNDINSSSGYLGSISDRSKLLYFNQETVGQYLYKQLLLNKRTRLKNQVFYRQDYLDEFERIWETQKEFHSELTPSLKEEIRDIIIFYQRKLKSQKGRVSFCHLESVEREVNVDGKKKTKVTGLRVCPRSSPIFQEFKIWHNLNNLVVKNKENQERFILSEDMKQILFDELNIKGNLSKSQILKLIVEKPTKYELNFDEIEGNKTNEVMYGAFQKILELEGNDIDFTKLSGGEIKSIVKDFLSSLGVNEDILEFDGEKEGKDFEKQDSYQFWHLLYSFDEDPMRPDHINKLLQKLGTKFGIKKEHASILADISFQQDYSSLSAKALRKIFPYIKYHRYDLALSYAGYDQPKSKDLKDEVKILDKNSLRNPIVEKILNQMINVVNAIIKDPQLGRPDEIRLEMARELKKSAKDRQEMTTQINKARSNNDVIRQKLKDEFGVKNPTRNDIIRYKLYEELKPIGYKTLYSNTYIPKEKLFFSKEFDIEHIIPKSRLFDDSFSNKTLELTSVNQEKADSTAADYVLSKYGEDGYKEYLLKLDILRKDKMSTISKAKFKKLTMSSADIPDGYIDRDLNETQYIAKKARDILETICSKVYTTTGGVTAELREDWDLVNVMQELNIQKYRLLGLTEQVEKKDGNFKERIVGWNKRNDHRHHAMDALTVAFTKHSHVQYFNYLNARKDKLHEKHDAIYGIENKETYRDSRGKRRFKPPMDNFRNEAKTHLKGLLISFKAKNKVVTRSVNKIKTKNGYSKYIELTPRGFLHKETVYGKSQKYVTKEVKITASVDKNTLLKVAKVSFRKALMARLEQYNYNSKKAFGGKNSLAKKPVYTLEGELVPEKVKLVWLEDNFTIRKEISKDLKVDKVIDVGVKNVLKERLASFNGDSNKAFSNLDENPIWLNKKAGIPITKVTISGVSEVQCLRTKKDHFGNEIIGKDGNPIPVDFVSTGNNHHVAIYRDEKGDLQEEVVSLFEAVGRVNENLPIIKKQHENKWEFLFSMKQNECFVFPSSDFDPMEIDLLDINNSHLISPHLFRVQKLSTKNYVFNHHLETKPVDSDLLKNKKQLAGINYQSIRSTAKLKGIVKVRINHLGKVVAVGEY